MMIISLYVVSTSKSNFKKIIALTILQNAIWLFFIAMAYIKSADIANPLPHVLMLTAIVVGVSTLAVAVALMIRIKNGR